MFPPDFASAFASEWIAAWNAHDLPRILAHYTDDFEMSSPRIRDIAGVASGVLRGKAAVGAYWSTALSRFPDLHFTLSHVFVGASSLCLHYTNQTGAPVIEQLSFTPLLAVDRSAAHY
ncbi:MAG TPA: nuclear transport factor 2 family protein [Kofleriaceae bacterium]|jgi:hypothetical protein